MFRRISALPYPVLGAGAFYVLVVVVTTRSIRLHVRGNHTGCVKVQTQEVVGTFNFMKIKYDKFT